MLQSRISDLQTIYDSCPTYCGLQSTERTEFCKGCPIDREDKEFRKTTLEALNKRCPDDWQEWGFDNLQAAVMDIMKIEHEPPETWTTTTEILVQIVRIERLKLDRAKNEKWRQDMADARANMRRGLNK